ncbi:SGNH/GDSL hydrolase family protein [Enterococcus sp. JM9B]|uniref:SGNH/GDSL hydrolase family protein n=1 Tax=Enterococcus sp. JM9B TaxID=1857216 RepID=UPI001374F761|nr:SGNH/GDSL hydrolase family protein [Enterococcus sp. JM9B]KAF1303136.1 hypothetical protein BAU16_05525 [Enterococcus sp. JM9B]
MKTQWFGKKILCIGDSLTEAGIWPKQVKKNLGCEIITHCKGGLGMIEILDGGESPVGKLNPLSVEQVKGVDLLIFFAGYNDRGIPDGKLDDCYDSLVKKEDRTVAGSLQFCIQRLYQLLKEANNVQCKLLIVTPHCVGKYSYIEVDGYHEYPEGSKQTVQTLAKTMERVARHNNIACCNLWEKSGINRFTWGVYSASPAADEVHCSSKGYQLIGDVITGAIISNYGI